MKKELQIVILGLYIALGYAHCTHAQQRITTAYTYDKIGQLTLENAQQSYYTLFIYSNAGNLSRKYSYSAINTISESNNLVGQVKLYPNPTDDLLHVQVSAAHYGGGTYTVCTTDGKVLLSGTFLANEGFDIDVGGLYAGYYLLWFTTETASHYSGFIKL